MQGLIVGLLVTNGGGGGGSKVLKTNDACVLAIMMLYVIYISCKFGKRYNFDFPASANFRASAN